MKLMATIGLVIAALLPTSAEAYDWSIVAKVTTVEVTYMPSRLPFKVDTAGGACPAGAFLQWTISGTNATDKAQNAQAILAALMTAQASGHSVTLYGTNSGCTVEFLYIN